MLEVRNTSPEDPVVTLFAGDYEPEFLPHEEYLEVVRGSALRLDLASQTVRVADWYANRTADESSVENETYTYLAFDKEGRANLVLLDYRHPAGWEPSAEEIDKMRNY